MTEFGLRQAFPAVVRDAGALPYGVAYRGWALAANILVCGIGLIFCLLAAWLLSGQGGAAVSRLMGLGFWTAAAAACAWRLWLLRSPWMILYPDRLEKRGLASWLTLYRNDIAGTRAAGSDRSGKWIEIVPQAAGARGVRIRERLRTDDPVVGRWLEGARDLTAEAVAADRSAILSDPRYGATHEDRAGQLALARTVARVVNVVCAAAGLLIYLGPSMYDLPPILPLVLETASVLVAAGAVYASRGLILWFAEEKARPQVIWAVAPAAAAGFAALNLDLVSPTPPMVAAGAAGLVLALVWYPRAQSSSRVWAQTVTAGFVGALAAYGLIVFADVGLDPSPPRVFPVRVLGRSYSSGRARSYYLKVLPSSDQELSRVHVPYRFYRAAPPGSVVCLTRRAGALSLGWISVGWCPAGTGPPAGAGPAPDAGVPFYPPAALRLGRQGSAVVDCAVGADLRLTDCRATSEAPAGYGFGEAAARRVTGLRLTGRPTRPDGRFQTRVSFRLQ